MPASAKHRGDHRDMHPDFTGNVRHSARGGTGRKNTATRKDWARCQAIARLWVPI